MNILHVTESDSYGGAARAAYRIHQSILHIGINSSMRVTQKGTDDNTVSDFHSNTFFDVIRERYHKRKQIRRKKNWKPALKEYYCFGDFGLNIVDEINKSDIDIVHLHFLNNILTLKDVGRIRKPIVWTMHDMWPFCGAEHYTHDDENARFKVGYTDQNKPPEEVGLDYCKITWDKKRKYWKKKIFHIVGTSRWLEEQVKSSVLFGHLDFTLIPYPLDTNTVWLPTPKDIARTCLRLPLDKKLILMGADGGTLNSRKGGDLLKEAVLKLTSSNKDRYEVVIFGQSKPNSENNWGCAVHWTGNITDDRLLSLYYSAADIMVVPSRQEAFGQTTTESMACGTPVAAFAIGGLLDTVKHKETGWLAQPFDTDDLAAGIEWMLEDNLRLNKLSENARTFVVREYNPEKIGNMYKELYSKILNK
jgi:glycosyltransferase involved in cell wall biosynthesis